MCEQPAAAVVCCDMGSFKCYRIRIVRAEDEERVFAPLLFLFFFSGSRSLVSFFCRARRSTTEIIFMLDKSCGKFFHRAVHVCV
jgi:hypothetical protein